MLTRAVGTTPLGTGSAGAGVRAPRLLPETAVEIMFTITYTDNNNGTAETETADDGSALAAAMVAEFMAAVENGSFLEAIRQIAGWG